MTAPEHDRAKAAESAALAPAPDASDDSRELAAHERALTVLAENEQWLADNQDKTIHSTERPAPGGDKTQ